jgi:hypothetical protein
MAAKVVVSFRDIMSEQRLQRDLADQEAAQRRSDMALTDEQFAALLQAGFDGALQPLLFWGHSCMAECLYG